MKKRYDIIYSLGYNCACAGYLRDLKLRLCSGPFDWVFGPSLKARAELIARNFEGYLNLECLENRETPNPEHDLYFDACSKTFFVHDFPPGVPAEKSFDAVREKYARRISRFYENVSRSKRALFVYFSILDYAPAANREDVLNAKKLIDEKFGPGKVDLWVIAHDSDAARDEVIEESPAPGAMFFHGDFRITPPPKNETVAIYGKKTLILPIFRRIGIPLRKELRLRWFRIVENLRCALIFDKEKRRAFRMEMRSRIYGRW